MATNLTFDVSALDRASKSFIAMGTAVDRFERRLDALDGKRVDAELGVKTDKAEREIGQFARNMKRRLEAAIKSLPDIELDADASNAQREIAGVRAELQALADKRIGVDIDAGDAEAQLAGLNARLREISDSSADVQVKADTAAALAALKVVSAEIDGIDGRTATVKIDVDRSLSQSIVGVTQLGRALQTLALPAAALALAPQLAGIGAAAVSMTGALALLPAVGAAAAASVVTLVVGLQGLGDALGPTGTPAQLKKANEALAKLSPAAREFVSVVREIGPAWKAVQLDVQERLLAGLGAELARLSGNYLPKVRETLGGIADGFNRAGRGVSGFLNSAPGLIQVRTSLDNIRLGASNMTGAILPITRAVVTLVEVGSSRLPRLGQAFTDVTTRFADFLDRAAASGSLDAFIDRGIAAVQQFGRIIADIGRSLLSIFDGADAAGVSFLDTVERITSSIDEFLSSAAGQQAITTLFTEIGATIDALAPGVKRLAVAVIQVISTLTDAGVLRGAASALSAMAVAAAPLLELLGQLASIVLPPLLAVLELLAPVLIPVAAGLLAIKAATALSASAARFPAWLLSTKDAATGANGALGRTSGTLRRFGDELKLQQGLAAATGQSVGKLGASLALFESRAGAAANSTNRVSTGLANFATSVDRATSSAGGRLDAFATRTTAAAERASRALETRIPAAATAAGVGITRGLSGVAENAGRIFDRLPQAAAAGVAGTVAAVRGLPATFAKVGDSIGNGLVTGVTKGMLGLEAGVARSLSGVARAADQAGDGIVRGLSASLNGATRAGDAMASGLAAGFRGVSRAGDAMVTGLAAGYRGLSAAGDGMVRGLTAGFRGITAAGDAVVTGFSRLNQAPAAFGRAVQSGMSTAASAASSAARGIVAAVDTIPAATTRMGSSFGTAVAAIPRSLGAAAAGVTSFASTVTTGFGNAVGAATRFGSSVAGLGTSIGSGLMRAGGSLVGFLGGPWGAALAVASIALGVFASKQQESAAAVAANKAKIESLAGSLDQFTGAATKATAAIVSQDLGSRTLADGTTRFASVLQTAGVNMGDFTAAATGNEVALAKVNGQLAGAAGALPAVSQAYNALKGELDANNISYEKFIAATLGNVQAQGEIAAAVGISAEQFAVWGGQIGEVGSALGQYGAQVKAATENTKASAAALGDFEAGLASVQDGLRGLAAGAPATAQLSDQFRAVGEAARVTAERVGQAATATNGVAYGADQATASMQRSRDAFIGSATAAGVGQKAAEELADSIGLIPGAVRTRIETNAADVKTQLQGVKAALDGIPLSKPVTVQALSDEAKAKLTELGAIVITLPDGRVMVTANTDQARAGLNGFLGVANTSTATPTIGANDAPARGALTSLLSTVFSARADTTIGANDAPAQGTLMGYLAGVFGSSATSTINAQDVPAQNTLGLWLGNVNTSAATSTINANDGPGRGTHTAFMGTVNGANATSTINANDGPGRGTLAGLLGSIVGTVGAVTVLASTGGALSALASLVASYAGRVITMFARVVTGGASGMIAPAQPMAQGGVIHAYRSGGMESRTMRPMSARRARVVAPNTMRLIGDRAHGDEAFIPINGSALSQAILSTTADRMGWSLTPKAQMTPAVQAFGDRVRQATQGYAPARAAAMGQFQGSAGSGLSLGPLLARIDRLRDAVLASGTDTMALEIRAQTAALIEALRTGDSAAATAHGGRLAAELGVSW